MPCEILAVHGFLGLPSDWHLLPWPKMLGERLQTIDLWPQARRAVDLADGASALKPASESRRPILLGYSMGGRLAMQALVRWPDFFSGAILVSAHPGLSADSDRQSRLKHDQGWIKKLRSRSFPEFLAEWNEQPVLRRSLHAESLTLPRRSQDFDSEALQRALDAWSLGRQENLTGRLRELRCPVLLVSGQEDEKFTELARQLVLGSSLEHHMIEGAGHRVPWDQPQAFIAGLQAWLQKHY